MDVAINRNRVKRTELGTIGVYYEHSTFTYVYNHSIYNLKNHANIAQLKFSGRYD